MDYLLQCKITNQFIHFEAPDGLDDLYRDLEKLWLGLGYHVLVRASELKEGAHIYFTYSWDLTYLSPALIIATRLAWEAITEDLARKLWVYWIDNASEDELAHFAWAFRHKFAREIEDLPAPRASMTRYERADPV